MENPAIKGTLFSAVVADLKRLLDDGRISPEAIEARLEPGDLALLEEKINPAGWYDIFAYHRLVEILRDVEGSGRDEYWFERGVRAARRLIEMGIYQQTDYLQRTRWSSESDPAARFKAFEKDLKLLMTLQASMLNFGDWSIRIDPDQPDRYRVEIRGVEGIPDGIFRAAAGLFSGMSAHTRVEYARHWTYDRPEPGLVVFRMTWAV